MEATRKYSSELRKIFPRNTTEEKRLFELLRSAYVQARYNPDFIVTKQDIEILFAKVKKLRDVVAEVCQLQIESYRQKEK